MRLKTTWTKRMLTNSSFIIDSTDILGNSHIHENHKVHYTSSINATPVPSSIPQLAQCEKRRFIPMKAINFDLPTSIHVHQASHSDVSKCSNTTTRTSSSTPAEDFEAQYSHTKQSNIKQTSMARNMVVTTARATMKAARVTVAGDNSDDNDGDNSDDDDAKR